MPRDHPTDHKAEDVYYLNLYRKSLQTSVFLVTFFPGACLSECFAPLVFMWKRRSTLFKLHTSGYGIRTQVFSFEASCQGCSVSQTPPWIPGETFLPLLEEGQHLTLDKMIKGDMKRWPEARQPMTGEGSEG